MSFTKSIKYYLIIMQSVIQSKTVVNFFGTTYLVSGNVVKRFGG